MITHDNPLLRDAEKFPVELAIYSKVKGDGHFQDQKAKDLNDLQFQEVDRIKKALLNLDDNKIEFIILTVYGVKINYNKTRALEFYRAFNFVVEQVERIYKKEQQLNGKANEKLKKAGIEKMAIFDSLNILDDLAVKYNTSPHEVELWTYGNVFIYALKMKFENDIQKNLSEIDSEK